MYALTDCNNFYASCERVFNPSLNNKPVVVLSNNDGCVIARSNEAKTIGIPMGAPAFQLKELIKKYDVKVFSSNYTLYGDLSNRVMNILQDNAPEVEIYSIDEAFLNFSGMKYANLNEHCAKIREQVFKSTGIPVSIGIAPSKTLSKIANKIAKKDPTKKNVYLLDNPAEIERVLKKTPIDDIWGIGRRYAYFLDKYNIKTAYDFANTSDNWVKKYMTVVGLRTKRELLGQPFIDMEPTPSAKKAICTSRSFGTMIRDLNLLEEAVSTFAHMCATKLREQKSAANIIMVFIHTNAFRKQDPQYARNTVIQLPVASNSSLEIIKYAKQALNRIYRKGFNYKKAGVIISGIVPEENCQLQLFDNIDRDKHRRLMKAMDNLNNHWGRNQVKIASQGSGRKWKLRQERLSPCYSTRWNDIITIKC